MAVVQTLVCVLGCDVTLGLRFSVHKNDVAKCSDSTTSICNLSGCDLALGSLGTCGRVLQSWCSRLDGT